jgi:arginyl-tRNA synthetase
MSSIKDKNILKLSLSPETAQKLGVDTPDSKSSYALSGRQGIGMRALKWQ